MGCASGTAFTDYAQSIDSSNKSGQEALVAYFNKKSIDNQNVFKAMSQNTDPAAAASNQMAMVLYTILSQQNDEKILAHFIPKYAEKPTTNGDIGKSLAENFLPTLVKAGAAAYLGGKIVDGLSETTTAIGSGATVVTQTSGNDISGGPNLVGPATDSYNPIDNSVTPEPILEE